jgi:hypothetical protein
MPKFNVGQTLFFVRGGRGFFVVEEVRFVPPTPSKEGGHFYRLRAESDFARISGEGHEVRQAAYTTVRADYTDWAAVETPAVTHYPSGREF